MLCCSAILCIYIISTDGGGSSSRNSMGLIEKKKPSCEESIHHTIFFLQFFFYKENNDSTLFKVVFSGKKALPTVISHYMASLEFYASKRLRTSSWMQKHIFGYGKWTSWLGIDEVESHRWCFRNGTIPDKSTLDWLIDCPQFFFIRLIDWLIAIHKKYAFEMQAHVLSRLEASNSKGRYDVIFPLPTTLDVKQKKLSTVSIPCVNRCRK